MSIGDIQQVKTWNNWKKNPIKQLEASKSSIKDLLSDLLKKTKGFKYQITLKVMLKKIHAKLNLDQFISI